ncbi:MAG: glycosyl transferase family 1, partial [bacterium]|nr:glycosyl transferase family 1 [bacterium]
MKTLLVSTYVPQKCGIATYTRDLIHAVAGFGIDITPHVVAIVNGEDSDYPPEVKFKLEKNSRDDYIKLADRVNSSSYA